MHGWDLALLVFAAFWAGAFLALLVRALIEDAAQRRLGRETVEAAQWELTLTRDRGATTARRLTSGGLIGPAKEPVYEIVSSADAADRGDVPLGTPLRFEYIDGGEFAWPPRA